MPRLLVHSQANIWLDRKKGEALFARHLPQGGIDKDDLQHTECIRRSMSIQQQSMPLCSMPLKAGRKAITVKFHAQVLKFARELILAFSFEWTERLA